MRKNGVLQARAASGLRGWKAVSIGALVVSLTSGALVFPAFAQGFNNFVRVAQVATFKGSNAALITIAADKQGTPPVCAANSANPTNRRSFSVDLRTIEGRTQFVQALSALEDGRFVGISGTGDCPNFSDVEGLANLILDSTK